MDLSFPLGQSVNDGIDPETSSLTYIRVDEVVNKAAQMRKGASLAKVDISEAYRICLSTLMTNIYLASIGMDKCTLTPHSHWSTQCPLVFCCTHAPELACGS